MFSDSNTGEMVLYIVPLPEGAKLPTKINKESPSKLPSLQHGFVPPKAIKLEYRSSNSSPLIAKPQPLPQLSNNSNNNSNSSIKYLPQPPPIPDDDKPIYQRPFYKKAKAISYTSPFLMELRKAIAMKNETNIVPPISFSSSSSDSDNESVSHYHNEDKYIKYRYNNYKELLETEQSYVNHVNILVNDYKQTLINDKGIKKYLKESEVSILIPIVIEQIKSLNTLLLNELLEQQSDWETKESPEGIKKLCDCFNKKLEYFKIYSIYCSSYGKACQKLTQLLKIPYVKLLFEQIKAKTKYEFPSLLIEPVQRLYKYPLFFTNLSSHIPLTHPHYDLLQNTMENIHKIANEVNEQVRLQENQLKLFEIAEQLNIADILIPGRKLISDLGLLIINTSMIKPVNITENYNKNNNSNNNNNMIKIVKQCESKSNHNKQLRWMLLFSDLIMISNKTVFGYKPKYEIDLNRITIQIPTIESGEQYHLWCIPTYDNSVNDEGNKNEKKTKAFCIWFDNEDQMKSFYQLVLKTKESLVNSISPSGNKRNSSSVYNLYILIENIIEKEDLLG